MTEAPKVALAGNRGAQRQLVAAECVLTKVRVEKNKLLGEELKDVRAQLADSMKENKQLRGDIFSMCSYLHLHSLVRKETDNNYVCRYIDGPSRRGGVRIVERSATRAVANARASSVGDAKYCQVLMAI